MLTIITDVKFFEKLVFCDQKIEFHKPTKFHHVF